MPMGQVENYIGGTGMYASGIYINPVHQQNDQLALEYARAKGTSIKEFAESKGISYRRMESLLRRRNMRPHLKARKDKRGYTMKQKEALLAEFEEMRMANPYITQASFAKGKGINPSTFANWVYNERKKATAPMPMPAKEEPKATAKATAIEEREGKGMLAYRFEAPSLSVECYVELTMEEVERIAQLVASIGNKGGKQWATT